MNDLKKIFVIVSMGLTPMVVHAAMQVPPPLQSVPVGIKPNVKANLNTPNNEYNQSQEQIQKQIDASQNDPELTTKSIGVPDGSIVPDIKISSGDNIVLYWMLIIGCGLILIGLLIFVWYRYRSKIKS